MVSSQSRSLRDPVKAAETVSAFPQVCFSEKALTASCERRWKSLKYTNETEGPSLLLQYN